MSSGGSQLLAWWQLLRAGNVFTAISNVIAGFLITQETWEPIAALPLLVVASTLLYEAGMVLNDVFDAELDAKERPERPIPSGRISRLHATIVGWILLGLGTVAGVLTSLIVDSTIPILVSVALAACIVCYNAGLKSTFLGPWAMGACRMLNVLLGAYAAADVTRPEAWSYAIAIGIYTVGLTFFARSEIRPSWNFGSVLGSTLMIATTLYVAVVAAAVAEDPGMASAAFIFFSVFIWFGLWSGIGTTRPIAVQKTVSRMIICFILIDALMVYAVMEAESALVILSLLIPTWIASRWAPMT